MDLSDANEPRSSEEYSDNSFGAEQALIDGTPTLRSYPNRFKTLYQRYGNFVILVVQLLLLVLNIGLFFLMKWDTNCVRSEQNLVYCKSSIQRR